MKKLIILLALTCFGSLQAQDLGIELEASHKLTKRLGISAEGELRSRDIAEDWERFSLGAGLQYKLASWLKADAGYLLMARRLEEHDSKTYHYTADWQARHRAYVSLTGSWEPVKHFVVSLRERYQYTRATAVNLERYYLSEPDRRASDKIEDGKNENILRSRLQGKYSRKKCAWEPYLSIEMLNDLSRGLAHDQMRYTLGTDYKINKHSQLGLSYRYKDKNDSDEKKGHLITFSLSHSF